MNPLLNISKIIFESFFKPFDETLLEKGIDIAYEIINSDWPQGIEDPEININAYGEALKVISNGKLRIIKNDFTLNEDEDELEKKILILNKKEKPVNYSPVLIVKDCNPFKYFFICSINKNVVGISNERNCIVVKNYTKDEIQKSFLLSNEYVGYIKAWSFNLK
jgi:hypothetical protein